MEATEKLSTSRQRQQTAKELVNKPEELPYYLAGVARDLATNPRSQSSIFNEISKVSENVVKTNWGNVSQAPLTSDQKDAFYQALDDIPPDFIMGRRRYSPMQQLSVNLIGGYLNNRHEPGDWRGALHDIYDMQKYPYESAGPLEWKTAAWDLYAGNLSEIIKTPTEGNLNGNLAGRSVIWGRIASDPNDEKFLEMSFDMASVPDQLVLMMDRNEKGLRPNASRDEHQGLINRTLQISELVKMMHISIENAWDQYHKAYKNKHEPFMTELIKSGPPLTNTNYWRDFINAPITLDTRDVITTWQRYSQRRDWIIERINERKRTSNKVVVDNQMITPQQFSGDEGDIDKIYFGERPLMGMRQESIGVTEKELKGVEMILSRTEKNLKDTGFPNSVKTPFAFYTSRNKPVTGYLFYTPRSPDEDETMEIVERYKQTLEERMPSNSSPVTVRSEQLNPSDVIPVVGILVNPRLGTWSPEGALIDTYKPHIGEKGWIGVLQRSLEKERELPRTDPVRIPSFGDRYILREEPLSSIIHAASLTTARDGEGLKIRIELKPDGTIIPDGKHSSINVVVNPRGDRWGLQVIQPPILRPEHQWLVRSVALDVLRNSLYPEFTHEVNMDDPNYSEGDRARDEPIPGRLVRVGGFKQGESGDQIRKKYTSEAILHYSDDISHLMGRQPRMPLNILSERYFSEHGQYLTWRQLHQTGENLFITRELESPITI